MSATGRGGERIAHDNYGTPHWAVERFLERCPLPGGRWYEPCGGDGAIIRAVNRTRSDVIWDATDIRPECAPLLRALTPRVAIGDFLHDFRGTPRGAYDVLLTNPPYSFAEEFVERGLYVARQVAMLLRLNFLGSIDRAKLFYRNMPAVYVLPNRPTFVTMVKRDPKTGKSRKTSSDATEYAWFVWEAGCKRRSASVEVLDLTSSAVLVAARAKAPIIYEDDLAA